MSEHAQLAPSSAYRWIICGGSARLSASVVDEGSTFASEGTAGHEVFSACVSNPKLRPAEFIGKKASNGIEIDEALAEHVEIAIEWVDAFRVSNPTAAIYTEHRVEIGAGLGLSPGVLWGTTDFAAFSLVELVIADLKLGYVLVDVEDNEQLILYAHGVMDLTGWMFERIRLVILQPKRGLDAKEILLTAAELRAWGEKIGTAAKIALQPDAPLVPNKVACKFCKAAGVCPELRKEMLALAKREFSSLHIYTGEDIANILDQAEMISGAVRRVRAHALRLLEIDPNHIPRWKRVQGEKKRRFKNEDTARVKLAELPSAVPEILSAETWLDSVAPRKLATPLQVESQLAAALHAYAKKSGEKLTKKAAMQKAIESISALVEKPEGEPTLVAAEDKREALGPVFTEADLLEFGIKPEPKAAERVIEMFD